MHSEQLSIVVPAFNAEASLARCLTAIRNSEVAPGELIVVSDGSRDKTVQVAKSFGAQVIDMSTRLGPAAARNHGATAARGSVILFLDADVEIDARVIGLVVQAFAADAALTGLIGSYDFTPDGKSFLSRYRNLLHTYFHQRGQHETIAFWGACGAVRRRDFFDLGGFDTAYDRPSIEDIDLGYRLKKRGAKLVLDPAIQVKHLKHWTLANMVKTDLFDRAIPWTKLILREGEIPNDLNVQWSQRVCVALAMAMLPALALGWSFAALCWLLVIAVNWPFYSFLGKRWHWGAALAAMPVHLLYFFYSGVGFGVGAAQHLIAQPEKQLAAGSYLK